MAMAKSASSIPTWAARPTDKCGAGSALDDLATNQRGTHEHQSPWHGARGTNKGAAVEEVGHGPARGTEPLTYRRRPTFAATNSRPLVADQRVSAAPLSASPICFLPTWSHNRRCGMDYQPGILRRVIHSRADDASLPEGPDRGGPWNSIWPTSSRALSTWWDRGRRWYPVPDVSPLPSWTAVPTAWPTISRRVGVGPGDPIGLQLSNGTEYIESMLACFKIRAVPVNVNYRYTSGELEYLYAGRRSRRSCLPQPIPAPRPEPPWGPCPRDGSSSKCPTTRSLRLRARGTKTALASASSIRSFPLRHADDLYCVYTGGRRACPRASCGATTTSSSRRWVAAIRCHSETTSRLPRSWPAGS